MSLDECIQSHTHRQYRIWLTFLQEQETQPDVVCYYLMQLTAEVRRVTQGKKSKAIRLKDFFLKFTGNKPKLTSTQRESLSRTAWSSLLGGPENIRDSKDL